MTSRWNTGRYGALQCFGTAIVIFAAPGNRPDNA